MVFKVNKKVHLVLFLFFIFAYLLFASNFKLKFNTSWFNYYNYLAEAFLHGKTHFVSQPQQLLDLSIYNHKIYLYFPPAPALIFLPFVYFFGLNFSDVFLVALIGALSCFVFYKMLSELKKSNILKLKIENRTIVLMTLFFAFGTNHFYLSLFGSVWWTAHIFAVFFLNCSLFFLFKFINSRKKLFIVFTTLFYALAVLSRLTIIFSLIFIFFIFYKKYLINYKQDKLALISFFMPIILIFSLYLTYNYLRFKSPFNVGYKEQIYSDVLDFNAKNYGRLNLIYLPFNLYYYAFHPLKLINHFPFYKPYHNGNSLFLLTPITLLIFFNWKLGLKRIFQNQFFMNSLIISVLLIFLPDLMNFSAGGPQIGFRYALDFMPFFLIFLLMFINNYQSRLSLFLWLLSLYFGLTSAYVFGHNLIEY